VSKSDATLVYDVRGTMPFGGSCGLVAWSLRHSLRQTNHAVRELWVPLDDKTSTIVLPQRKRASGDGVHVFFEELFPRCSRDTEFFRHPNIVFFNLPYFRFPEHCDANGLIFNSKYLMDCFLHEAFPKGLSVPPTTYAPLAMPLHDFPDGYPSSGTRIDRRALKLLAQEVHMGHALRPKKPEPFATLCIMHHLNQLAKARSTKPFLLLIPAIDLPRFNDALRDMPIPPSTIESLLPVGHLQNPSVIAVMRNSRFGLCYDKFVEAYGFYPVESVYSGCPIFTNGTGNLRYLLPPGSGIEVHETLQMYFGTVEDRVRAYLPVAEHVFRVATEGSGPALCRRGAQFIDRHYSMAVFTQRIRQFLRVAREFRRTKAARKQGSGPRSFGQVSPYLRLADWRRGRFVTDWGTEQVAPDVSMAWKRLLSAKQPPKDIGAPAIPRSIGALRMG